MEKNVTYIKEDNSYIFNCPHCSQLIQVLKYEINCKIFRHGYYKNSLEQIHPHASKKLCDDLFDKGLIFGCGKPFILQYGDSGIIENVSICDYI
jgi:hypothetical protein